MYIWPSFIQCMTTLAYQNQDHPCFCLHNQDCRKAKKCMLMIQPRPDPLFTCDVVAWDVHSSWHLVFQGQKMFWQEFWAENSITMHISARFERQPCRILNGKTILNCDYFRSHYALLMVYWIFWPERYKGWTALITSVSWMSTTVFMRYAKIFFIFIGNRIKFILSFSGCPSFSCIDLPYMTWVMPIIDGNLMLTCLEIWLNNVSWCFQHAHKTYCEVVNPVTRYCWFSVSLTIFSFSVFKRKLL